MTFDEIIQLSIFVTNIENIFRQIPIILHLGENTAYRCRGKQNWTVFFDFILPDHDEEKLSHTIYSSSHRTYLFSDPIPFAFQRKLSKSSFICDIKYTFQLIMMTHWPHGILSSKHQKCVERRNFWHNKKTFETNHHEVDTFIKFLRIWMIS